MINLLVKIQNRISFSLSFISEYLFLAKNSVAPRSLKLPANGRALVVGTGPSVDCLTSTYLRDYSLVVLINHAIELPVFNHLPADHPELLWYSGDPLRLEELTDKLNCSKIAKCYCHFMYCSTDIKCLSQRINGLILLKPLILRLSLLSIPILFAGCLAGRVHDIDYFPYLISSCMRRRQNALPVLGRTSALSAVLLLAMNNFLTIDLIGCDFDNSRSSLLPSLDPASFGYSDVHLKFHRLSLCLKHYGVIVNNRSWET